MRKLFITVLCLGLLAIAANASAWSFGSYSFAQNTTSAYSEYQPGTYAYAAPTATATAWGCSACQTLNTYATTSSYAVSGDGWFKASASAYAVAESYPDFNCNEPPVCEDGDGDGVCDESDNCEFDPNTDQADVDDDQIGDVCDECPTDSTNTCNNDPTCDVQIWLWLGEGQGDWEMYLPDGTFQWHYVGDGNGTYVCDPDLTPCLDGDNDGHCDSWDDCLDTAPGAIIDEFGCEVPPECDLTCQLAEACPCENDWVNHGAYVVCVNTFERDHRGEPGIGDVVNLAGNSDCGGSHVGTPN